VDKSVIGRPTCAYSMPACITMACVQSTAWRCLPQPVDTLAGYVNNRCMITDRDGRCGSFVFGWQWPLTAGWHISIEVSHYRLAQTVHTKHPLRPNAQKLTDNFEAALIDIDNVACTGGLSSVSKVFFSLTERLLHSSCSNPTFSMCWVLWWQWKNHVTEPPEPLATPLCWLKILPDVVNFVVTFVNIIAHYV